MFAILTILLLFGYSSASNQFNGQEQHAIYELIIGPKPDNPRNLITVITSDGKAKEMTNFNELVDLLSTLHYRIPYVTMTGVRFDYEMVRLITAVDNVLFTGHIKLFNCHFTPLDENEILDIFTYILRGESLQLVQNPGLTSEILNQALTERIFNSSLSVIGDDEDDIRLKPELLMDFLHNPTHPRAILTINPGFIDGGISKFVEMIVKRFKGDTEPIFFYLQLTENVNLPLLSDSPLHNEATDEYLFLLEVMSGNKIVRSSKAEMYLITNHESSQHYEL